MKHQDHDKTRPKQSPTDLIVLYYEQPLEDKEVSFQNVTELPNLSREDQHRLAVMTLR